METGSSTFHGPGLGFNWRNHCQPIDNIMKGTIIQSFDMKERRCHFLAISDIHQGVHWPQAVCENLSHIVNVD